MVMTCMRDYARMLSYLPLVVRHRVGRAEPLRAGMRHLRKGLLSCVRGCFALGISNQLAWASSWGSSSSSSCGTSLGTLK